MATLNELIAATPNLQNRATLEPNFNTGEIPTQEHFYNLIHNPVNRIDDGIFKTIDHPLCILAATNEVLHFYNNTDNEPVWNININSNNLNYTNSGGNRLTLDSTGRLGIGTTTPADTLDVNGDIRIRGADIKDAGGTARITLTDNGRLDLKEDHGAIAISISTNGRVGIGTTTPANALDVNGDIRIRGADIRDAGGTARITLTDNGRLDLKEDNGAIALCVDTNGNIGIGTIDPDYKLTVGQGAVNNTNYVEINSATWGGVLFHGGGRGGSIVYNHTNNYMHFGTSPGNGTGPWERMRIDSNGNIGIGTTSPADALDVNGDIRIRGANIRDAGGTSRITFTNGNIGIGTSSPERNLDVVGTGETYLRVRSSSSPFESGLELLRNSATFGADGSTDWRIRNYAHLYFYSAISGVTTERFRISRFGNVYVNGTSVHSSDHRLKNNIQPLKSALSKLLSLRGTRFIRKDITDESSYQFGLIAQEVEAVFPELVIPGSNGMKALNYSGIIAPIIEAIKEQQEQIIDLKSSNHELNNNSKRVNYVSEGLDFAEYFESKNGKSIPLGTSVVLEDSKIRPAKKNETPIGVISAMPGHVGGDFGEWPNKYLRDDFGNIIMEDIQEEIMVPKKEKVTRERQKVEKKTVTDKVTRNEVVLKKGKYKQTEITEEISRDIEMAQFEEVKLYNDSGRKVIGKHLVPVMETYEEEVDVFDKEGQVVMIVSGEYFSKKQPKLNPEYNPEFEYVTRSERPEWNTVGLLGQLPLKKGQPVAASWIKIKDI